MKVIGAASGGRVRRLSRRPSKSSGFGPCYHMSEAVKNPDHRKVRAPPLGVSPWTGGRR